MGKQAQKCKAIMFSYSEFKANLRHMSPCLKRIKTA